MPSPHPTRAARLLVLLLLAGAPLAAQQPLTLRRAVELAWEHGYPAQAAAATRDAARYRDRAFYSGLLPRLSLSGTLPDYNRRIIEVLQPDGSTLFRPQNQTNASLNATLAQSLPFTGGELFVTSSLARYSVSGDDPFRTWSSTPVSFGLRQPLLRPNVTGWERREQPVRSDVAERQYREAREDIALQITALFFAVYEARVGLQTATANAAVNDTIFTLNKGRYQVGRIGENDLLQSELALLRARTRVDGARLDLERSTDALRLGLNLPPGTPLEVVAEDAVPVLNPDTGLAVAEALRNRAAVSEVELQEIQADRRVTEARLNNGLGATIVASYGYNATAPELSLAYDNLLEARRFSFSVQVPILQWGLAKESVQAAQAERDRVRSNARSTLDQTAHEARFAALGLAQARRALALSATADTVARKRFEVAYNRYVIGRITIDNLFIAQNEMDQARTQYVQALRAYWEAYYRLRRATLFDFEAGTAIR